MNKENWKIKNFEDCINKVIYTNKIQKINFLTKGIYPIISQEEGKINGFWDDENDVFKIRKPIVVFGDHTRVLKYVDFDFVLGADGVKILEPIDDINSKFFFYFLTWLKLPSLGYSRHYKLLKESSIPIPPLPIQEAIVKELDTLHRLKELQEKQLTEYDNLARSTFHCMFGDPVENDRDWKVKKLGKVAPVCSFKGDPQAIKNKYWLLNLDVIEQGSGNIQLINLVGKKEIKQSTIKFNEDNVLYSKLRPYLNKVVIPRTSGYCTTELLPLLPNKVLLNRVFLALLLRSNEFVKFIQEKTNGAKMPRVNMDEFRRFNLILPPLSLQNQFAERIKKIEEQKKLVKKGIEQTQMLIDYTMDKYYG